jgi:hypothetical protein
VSPPSSSAVLPGSPPAPPAAAPAGARGPARQRPGPSTPPAFTPPALPAGALLRLSRRGLLEAATAGTAAERYAAAHLSALRAAAAVLACHARPASRGSRRSRPTSAWVLLAVIVPELGEWAAFFAAGAGKRAAAEAGLPHAVTTREADDLLRDAEQFLLVVEGLLQLPGTSAQPLLASG